MPDTDGVLFWCQHQMNTISFSFHGTPTSKFFSSSPFSTPISPNASPSDFINGSLLPLVMLYLCF